MRWFIVFITLILSFAGFSLGFGFTDRPLLNLLPLAVVMSGLIYFEWKMTPFLLMKAKILMAFYRMKKVSRQGLQISELKNENLELKNEIEGLHRIWLNSTTESFLISSENKKENKKLYAKYLTDIKFGLSEEFNIESSVTNPQRQTSVSTSEDSPGA